VFCARNGAFVRVKVDTLLDAQVVPQKRLAARAKFLVIFLTLVAAGPDGARFCGRNA